jgi:Cu/Ag efflux protein CusF
MGSRIAFALSLCLAFTHAEATPREISATRSEAFRAKVKKVDQKTRMVTLVGEDGIETTFKAGEEVRNLKQLKAGDVVTSTLTQTLTLWVLGKDDPSPELAVGSAVYRAKPGEKPAAEMLSDVSGVATVEAIAADKSSITLKGPQGRIVQLAVRDPRNLEGIKVGARLGFVGSETIGASVTPGAKKK